MSGLRSKLILTAGFLGTVACADGRINGVDARVDTLRLPGRVDTLRFASSADTFAIGTIFTNRLVVGGKITANSFDPVYLIGDTRHSTYAPSMPGIKEEVAGNIYLRNGAFGIDFDTVPRGSNLWVFNQVTNFGDRMGNLQISLTPGFDGRVWYTKNPENNALTIYGTRDGEVSYRLTADRFDSRTIDSAQDNSPREFGIRLREKRRR